MGTAALSVMAARRNRIFRQPTPDQRDSIAYPLARIACRFLPLDALDDTLVDVTECAVATHNYVLDGPLTYPAPVLSDLNQDNSEGWN